MITKVEAAKIATAAGCSMLILNGSADAPVSRLKNGERSTLFPADADPLTVRKQWIRGLMAPKGFIHVDAGALAAMQKGASLLAAGVTEVDGTFFRGDMVALMGPKGKAVGQGFMSYDAHEAIRIKGCKMHQAKDILGYPCRSSLIHRNDLVLF